ncbi:hypothetical protein MIND_00780100 [Mycena indigotica]|uniref:Uncharacterized protein n=1 Tax=Mycena indigotica TaxID=2126181 RepID=A0A8H6W548_9AGAR|nr:uncharacterized protein MIND_00780100 [Mycena indigotica]KAF7302133.1 hypothetical protein MIND_00780100 [Mycena indigotica]
MSSLPGWPFDKDVQELDTPWTVTSPTRRAVRRLPPFADIPNVPSHVWTLPGAWLHPNEAAADILWRDEYRDVLRGILICIERRLAHLKRLEAEEDYLFPEADYLEVNVQPTPTNEPDTFQNYFDDPSTHNLALRSSILVLTGCPGNGKSFFLAAIFLLRIAAGLPTVFVRSHTHLLIFRDGHLGEMKPVDYPLDNHLSLNLPENAWILVDTSDELPNLPPVLKISKHFIVQAASLCDERFKYTRTTGAGCLIQCVLKPFTIQDILAARSLNRDCHATEAALVEFFEKYGGSARHAYAEAAAPDRFASEVLRAANALDESRIYDTLHWNVYGFNIATGYSGISLSAFPTSDQNRSLYKICPPTPHIAAMLLDRMLVSRADAKIKIVKQTAGVLTAGCQAIASGIFDDSLPLGSL